MIAREWAQPAWILLYPSQMPIPTATYLRPARRASIWPAVLSLSVAAALVASVFVPLPHFVAASLAAVLAGATLWHGRPRECPVLAATLETECRELRTRVEDLQRQAASTSEQADELTRANAKLREMQASLEASYEHLRQVNERLEQQATTDSMTGLANHRAFQERLRGELAQASRLRQPLALLMADVDYFKEYNDSFGHPAGDEVLKSLASLLSGGTRVGDLVARYGGEEFAVILPGTDSVTALAVAERLRALAESHDFPLKSLTISLGVAMANLDRPDAEALVCSADEALYLAKSQGRNRVCTAPLEPFCECEPNEDLGSLDLYLGSGESPTSLARRSRTRGVTRPDCYGGLEGILQESAGPVLASILAALDMRDHEAPGHPQRVARYSLRLALAAAERFEQRRSEEPLVPLVTPSDLRDLAIGALLHDIGNIRVPDHILRRAGALTERETAIVRMHPRLGAEIVADLETLDHALPVIKYHHERWDGQGYPYGLSGEEIPMSARIFAVSDALDAMTSDQPYRKRLSFAVAREEIRRHSGSQFDPAVVEAFMAVPTEDWRRLRDDDEPMLPLADAA